MSQISMFDARPILQQATSNSGATAVVTIAASADRSWALQSLNVSSPGGTAAVEVITVAYTQRGTAMTLTIGLAMATATLTATYDFWGRVMADPNTAIVITAAAITSQVVQLDVFYT